MTNVAYIIVIDVVSDIKITLRSIGTVTVERGSYVYIGSARKVRPYLRVHRHFITNKKLRWHIDYLTSSTNVRARLGIICYSLSEDSLYNFLLNYLKPVVKGFGCSDYRGIHVSHLFKLDSEEVFNKIVKLLAFRCSLFELFIPH